MVILSLDAWEIPIDILYCRCLEAGLAVCHNQRGYARASHPASPDLLLQIQVVTRTRGGLRQPTGEPSFLRLWSQQLGSLSGTCGGDWHLFRPLRHSSNPCNSVKNEGTNSTAKQVDAMMPLNTLSPSEIRPDE
jgi:hypothetical protein